MSLGPNSYGSVAGVQTYVRHLISSGSGFSTSTTPTLAEVEGFLDQMSGRLNGWLAREGYTIPVTNANAKLILSNFANLGAAGLAELTQRSAGYSADNQNKRENKFLKEFEKAEAFIASGALAALNAAQSDVPGPLAGLSIGGRTMTGQRLRPIFTRRFAGNNPTAETGTPEPGYEGTP